MIQQHPCLTLPPSLPKHTATNSFNRVHVSFHVYSFLSLFSLPLLSLPFPHPTLPSRLLPHTEYFFPQLYQQFFIAAPLMVLGIVVMMPLLVSLIKKTLVQAIDQRDNKREMLKRRKEQFRKRGGGASRPASGIFAGGVELIQIPWCQSMFACKRVSCSEVVARVLKLYRSNFRTLLYGGAALTSAGVTMFGHWGYRIAIDYHNKTNGPPLNQIGRGVLKTVDTGTAAIFCFFLWGQTYDVGAAIFSVLCKCCTFNKESREKACCTRNGLRQKWPRIAAVFTTLLVVLTMFVHTLEPASIDKCSYVKRELMPRMILIIGERRDCNYVTRVEQIGEPSVPRPPILDYK